MSEPAESERGAVAGEATSTTTYLEFFGKLTSVLYFAFVATVILLPTLAFVASHSAIGYGRWKLQRELWRRDVDELEASSRV